MLVIYSTNCYTNAEPHSATCFDDDSSEGAAESSSTNKTARDGTKWEFMELGVEARGRHTAQNVLTNQLGLSRFALKMADSLVGTFRVTSGNHILKHIQQCTSSNNLDNEEWRFHFVSSMYLLHCYMCEERMVAKTFPFTISE